MQDTKQRLLTPAWMRRAALWLFIATVLSMAFVHHPVTGWNVNTRLALVYAIVDQGTFTIDAYHAQPPLETWDKAVYEGHYYSDKIFGVSLLAVPVYAVMKWIGFLFSFAWPFQVVHYVVRLFAVSLPAALSVTILWALLVRAGAPPRRALACVAFAFHGSLWFGYSTIFMPYAPGIAASLAALYLIMFPPKFRLTYRVSLVIGLLLGFAMLCDLIFGLIVAAVAVVYLLRLVDQTGVMGMRAFAEMRGPRTPVRGGALLLATAAVGGAIPLLLFMIYCYSIFGEFTIPYKYEALDTFREEMSRGFMGITSLKPHALYFLTVHPFRGIFFWYPWIALAIIGFVRGIRSSGRRRIFGWLGLYALLAYLIFNASYYMWWGGWAMGPRLMLPMMVAVPLGLGELVQRDRHRAWWWVLIAVGVISIAMNLPLSFLDPQTRTGIAENIVPNLRPGDDVPVSQFTYLAAFYSFEFLLNPEAPAYWKWCFPLMLLGSGLFFFLAARVCPEKHLPFERLELPHINFDGTAAPAPSRSPR